MNHNGEFVINLASTKEFRECLIKRAKPSGVPICFDIKYRELYRAKWGIAKYLKIINKKFNKQYKAFNNVSEDKWMVYLNE